MAYAEKMTASNEEVDKRLINLYMIMKADQMGHFFGFNNDLLTGRKRASIKKSQNP